MKAINFFFLWQAVEDYGEIWYINDFKNLNSSKTLTVLFLSTIMSLDLYCFLLSKSLFVFNFLGSSKAAGLILVHKISSYSSTSSYSFTCQQNETVNFSSFRIGSCIAQHEYPEIMEVSEAVAQRCSVEKEFLEISQSSQKNTCTGVSFLIELQASGQQLY